MSLEKTFCHETFLPDGQLSTITFHYKENFNFAYDVVDEMATREPDKRALVWCNTAAEEHIFTFRDIQHYSNQYANVFMQSGIKKGDRVLLVLKRHYEYWFCAIALHKIGAVMIPATHMLTTEDFVYRIQKAHVQAVVATTEDGVCEKIQVALSHCDTKPLLWCVKGLHQGFRHLPSEAKEAKTTFTRQETKASDDMMLYFTSGTTGNPKGVIHNHTYPLAHIVTAKYWQGAVDGGLHFTIAETGWAKASWGKLYGQWLVGSAVMVYDFDNFEPKQLSSIINHYGVTSFCAPPTVYRYLVRKELPALPTLKSATTAGEVLSPEIFKKFTQKTGIQLREGYGQTETTLLMANFQYASPIPGAMGKPSPLYHLELRTKEGERVKEGEIGEVVIIPNQGEKPIGVFSGYLDNEEQYDYVWRDGVYHTGDAAYQDEEGVFYFHGRFDDIIKTGGFRVGPYEIEHILAQHPAVVECSVIGIPDSLRGQAIKAIIVLSSRYQANEEMAKEIKHFCNQQLAEYKWIRHIEFVQAMPKTISGKIQKRLQREQGA